jgi:hypothetical protein
MTRIHSGHGKKGSEEGINEGCGCAFDFRGIKSVRFATHNAV